LDKIHYFAGLKDKMNKILITKEVAEMLRVSEEYVRELIRHRKLKAYKEGRRGGFRITMGEIERYINRKHKEMEGSRK
jgi:excisionase family DNA binding protein